MRQGGSAKDVVSAARPDGSGFIVNSGTDLCLVFKEPEGENPAVAAAHAAEAMRLRAQRGAR